MNKYSIGEKVWIAKCGTTTKSIKCPDCFGQRYLTVILGNGTHVAVECTGCRFGYQGSSGYVTSYEYEAVGEQVEITGLEIRCGKVTYSFGGNGVDCYFTVNEQDVFETQTAAKEKADAIAKEKAQEEMERLHCRPKDHHGWAFNATYHRSCIRRSEKELQRIEKELAYHRSNLDRKAVLA